LWGGALEFGANGVKVGVTRAIIGKFGDAHA
jgi:hypothetical protein